MCKEIDTCKGHDHVCSKNIRVHKYMHSTDSRTIDGHKAWCIHIRVHVYACDSQISFCTQGFGFHGGNLARSRTCKVLAQISWSQQSENQANPRYSGRDT
jgi:hypothetical protein